ncbi:DegT/DnrJ/EryC1/StrS family aminotransferase [Algoriphagus halophytocola]|uniref:DegT/DnrJ/EryC1/StrS family aminotransferase n=1 Tax=Algoriphagus halophytocola TaxID=2991499 RepID=A0ABY6MK53_9BACT|nr:DegT/DnrJ/EryC1/StrS family aminotransferase [Algoriphagus sp. TR-M5]UZD23884.1 DegT/DnrJ/EryC1/StrS family aminotransferase [Algoriphagus sp. TR-M5]
MPESVYNKSIQMVDLKTQYEGIKSEVDAAIQEVISQSTFINGPQVKKFARELKDYTGAGHVITCGNGTDALQIAMMALDFQAGDEIIVPAFTYVATVEVIALLGLTPVFVDVFEHSFELDVRQLESKITEKTVGIVTVHLYGQCSNMEEILRISDKYKLKVIEDGAQALGASYTFSDGTKAQAGTMGDIGITSFFPSKNLGCFGDGGAMFTNNEHLAEKLQMIANHGQKKKYFHDSIGVNSRLDSLQAAVLSVKLKHLDSYSEARNKVADQYDQAFTKHPGFYFPERVPYSTHVFHQYTIRLRESANRDQLKSYLQEKGIPSMIYYPLPLHLQKAYLHFGGRVGQFPVAEKLCKEVLSLPIHTEMKAEQQEYIIDSVLSFFKAK